MAIFVQFIQPLGLLGHLQKGVEIAPFKVGVVQFSQSPRKEIVIGLCIPSRLFEHEPTFESVGGLFADREVAPILLVVDDRLELFE